MKYGGGNDRGIRFPKARSAVNEGFRKPGFGPPHRR